MVCHASPLRAVPQRSTDQPLHTTVFAMQLDINTIIQQIIILAPPLLLRPDRA